MDTLKLDKNGDLALCENKNLAILKDLEALIQTCENYAKALTYEMIFNLKSGIPYFQTAFNERVNIPLFKHSLKNRLLEVKGVIEVLDLKVIIKEELLSYRATIKTIYGNGVING